MALKPGSKQRLLAARAYKSGVVASDLLLAFLKSIEDHAPTRADVPDVKEVKLSALTSTSTSVGAYTRLYGVRAESPSGSSNDVIVSFLDGTVAIGCGVKCTTKQAAEAYFAAGSDGFGVPISGGLNAKAFQAADGTSNPAAGDRPTVYVLVG